MSAARNPSFIRVARWGISITPGATQLTLICRSASSIASTFVNITTPAFDAQ